MGLSTTGTQGYDPALIQVRQTGPTFWVGNLKATESGLLFILIALGLLVLALVYISVFEKSPPWTTTPRRGLIGAPVGQHHTLPLRHPGFAESSLSIPAQSFGLPGWGDPTRH